MNNPTKPENILDPNTAYDAIGYKTQSNAIHCFAQDNGVKATINNEEDTALGPQQTLAGLLKAEAPRERVQQRLDRHVAYAYTDIEEHIDTINNLTTSYLDQSQPLTIRSKRHGAFNAIDNVTTSLEAKPKNTRVREDHRRRMTRRGYGIALLFDETAQAATDTIRAVQDDLTLLRRYEGKDEAPQVLDDTRNANRSLTWNAGRAFDNIAGIIEALNQGRDKIFPRINNLAQDFPEQRREELQAQYQHAGKSFYE